MPLEGKHEIYREIFFEEPIAHIMLSTLSDKLELLIFVKDDEALEPHFYMLS